MLLRRILGLFIGLCLTGCVSILPPCKNLPNKPRHTIRFATYNVYWQNASKDKRQPHSITRIIRHMNPDIIVLQETYCFMVSGLEKYFLKDYPYRHFRHFHRPNYQNEDGLGILSKYPIVKERYFPPLYGWFPGWLYVIKTPQGYIQVLNVHLNPKLVSDNNIGLFAEGLWLTPKLRLQEISYYYQFLNPHLPTIIAGDFNENDNGAAAKFLRQHNFVDLLLGIPKYIKTWHCKYLIFNFTGRYDRIYTTPDIKTYRCGVLQKGFSDHYPVIMDFSRLPKGRSVQP